MIVWDLGGVVARFLPDRRSQALAAASDMTPAEVDEAIRTYGLGAEADTGRLSADEVWARATAAFGGLDRDMIRQCWALAFKPDPAVLAVVDIQPGPSALLTDNGPILEACLDFELASTKRRFDHCLLSWRLRATKPNPAAFNEAAALLARAPQDLVLVDDRQENIDGAEAAGWSGIVFRNATSTEQALRQWTLQRHR